MRLSERPDSANGVRDFRWSPDGRSIAYTERDPIVDEVAKARKEQDDAWVVGEYYQQIHLHVIGVGPRFGRAARADSELTEGEFTVTTFEWTPDGKDLVFCHKATPRIEDWRVEDISRMPAGGGEVVPVVVREGMDSQPLVSPDGRTVAFVSDLGKPSWPRDWRICLVPTGGGEITVLPATFDSWPELIEWAPDGSGIYYWEMHRTSTHVFFMTTGGEYRIVDDSPGQWASVDISGDGSLIAYTWQDFYRPEEVYVALLADNRACEAKKLTGFNDHQLELPVVRAEERAWKSDDGTEIEGILYYPANFKKGEKYPLLLEVHGGPSWAYSRIFVADIYLYLYPIQILCQKGFAVLRPNPRGSTAYGAKFRFSTLGDWGGVDMQDVLSGVDALIAEGIADPERLGVMGWSYGGFLTSNLLTRTDRFKAAAVGAGTTNLISFTGTTDINGFIPSWLRGEHWEKPDLYRERSAVQQVGRTSTPTLIIHGELDKRVPIGQGYELYNALKRSGVDVKMFVLPRCSHGPAEPKMVMSVAKLHLEWFCEKLLGEE